NVGDSCAIDGTMPGCNTQFGLSCINNACQPSVLALPGEPCGVLFVPTRTAVCVLGGACIKVNADDRSGTCVAPAPDGAACNDDETIGPPCLLPAKCVTGICTVPDPRRCRTH